MSEFKDCSVIVRSVGERTEGLCISFLESIFGKDFISIVSETPFSKTLEKSLELGVSLNRKWTLCIDSDLLVWERSLRVLFERASSSPDHCFEFHGFVFDKFFEDFRPAGNHLYKTKHLGVALEKLRSFEGGHRPETEMLQKMRNANYPNKYFSDVIVGIHDFEQFYSDIFRKGYLHSHKHTKLLSKMIPIWRERSLNDYDFQVFLYGVAAGISKVDQIAADKSTTPFDALRFFSKSLIEKEKIKIEDYSQDYVEEYLKKANKPLRKQAGIIDKLMGRLKRTGF